MACRQCPRPLPAWCSEVIQEASNLEHAARLDIGDAALLEGAHLFSSDPDHTAHLEEPAAGLNESAASARLSLSRQLILPDLETTAKIDKTARLDEVGSTAHLEQGAVAHPGRVVAPSRCASIKQHALVEQAARRAPPAFPPLERSAGTDREDRRWGSLPPLRQALEQPHWRGPAVPAAHSDTAAAAAATDGGFQSAVPAARAHAAAAAPTDGGFRSRGAGVATKMAAADAAAAAALEDGAVDHGVDTAGWAPDTALPGEASQGASVCQSISKSTPGAVPDQRPLQALARGPAGWQSSGFNSSSYTLHLIDPSHPLEAAEPRTRPLFSSDLEPRRPPSPLACLPPNQGRLEPRSPSSPLAWGPDSPKLRISPVYSSSGLEQA